MRRERWLRRFLKRVRVPMPSIMLWGERRMRSRWMWPGLVTGGSTIKRMASFSASGSKFAHSALVWTHKMVLKVLWSQVLRKVSSGMVSYLFCGLPRCLSKNAQQWLGCRCATKATRREGHLPAEMQCPRESRSQQEL